MKMLKILILSSLVTLSLASVAQAAVVSGVEGRVVVERAGKQSLVTNGTVLQEGDRIITTGNGKVKIQFDSCPARFPDSSRVYGSSEALNISAANPCGNSQKVRLRTETVTDGSGFNNRPVNLPSTGNVPVSGFGGAAGIAAGVIGAGFLINEINDDDPVSGS